MKNWRKIFNRTSSQPQHNKREPSQTQYFPVLTDEIIRKAMSINPNISPEIRSEYYDTLLSVQESTFVLNKRLKELFNMKPPHLRKNGK